MNKRGILRKCITALAPTVICIIMGLLAGYLILLISNPSQASNGFRAIISGGFIGGARGIGNVFYYATPLLMVGLGVAVGFKTGVFNIGGPGQFILGGYFAMLTAHMLDIPRPFSWIIPILVGTVAAALWAMIAGLLNVYFKVNIVISTILLNYIGMYLVNLLIRNTIYDPGKNQALLVPEKAQLPKMGLDRLFPDSSINSGIVIAVAIAVIIYILIYKTTKGYEMVAGGLNPLASVLQGMPIKKNAVFSMTLSGALVGIGGALMYLSDSGTSIQVVDTLASEGFDGISVALLASNHPLGVILTALFVASLTVGGFYMQTYRFVPEIIDVIIAVIIYFSAFSLLIIQNYERLRIWFLNRKGGGGR